MNIFLLHRDLRIEDNNGLNELIKKNKDVYLFFIFNNKQIKNNKYFNDNSFNYLINSLKDLNKNVNINIFKADDEIEVFERIIKNKKIERIYTNLDYTHFSLERSKTLKSFCFKNNIEYKEHLDYLLFMPGTIVKKDNNEYKVFKYFYLMCLDRFKDIKAPITQKFNFLKYNYGDENILKSFKSKKPLVPYKRKNIIDLLENLDIEEFKKRDYWYIDTTCIGTAIKYGIISCREVIYFFNKKNKSNTPLNNVFIRQFIWREFYYHLYYLRTINHGYKFGDNYLTKFNNYDWENDPKKLEKWKKGETGFPLIDASMRILNETGKMHNRLRMITASFLIKNLNIHWKYGEEHFAKKLIDYDPIVNQASWQWVAGTGFETNPFFRIFSIPRQEERFDPERIFIKKHLKLDSYKTLEIVDLKKSRITSLEKYKKI